MQTGMGRCAAMGEKQRAQCGRSASQESKEPLLPGTAIFQGDVCKGLKSELCRMFLKLHTKGRLSK